MTSLTHYATCRCWATGNWNDCDCHTVPAWRIRKEDGELFPWRIWRRTEDDSFEHVMRCSSHAGAIKLVLSFIWLRENAIDRETHA